MHLIGITGKARAGKDTFARELIDLFDVISPMAGPLKAGVATMLGVDRAALDDDVAKEQAVPPFDFTLREAMQTLGTEWGRSLDRDIWVKVQQRYYQKYAAQPAYANSLYVIPDIRFDNEAEFILAFGGKLVEVCRDGVEGAVPEHASEAGLSPAHPRVVVQNTTREALREEAKELRKTLIGDHHESLVL